ncbi:unnamed protein product [Ranitomeya imitator]|uniref:Uncharacterized protein n=2 Tax=Ranitomeya imitator TaxID=111125 RepID=A0ABN9MIQ7_9NEOB|nr:unnamed protein product [Ranitomeya imitator]
MSAKSYVQSKPEVAELKVSLAVNHQDSKSTEALYVHSDKGKIKITSVTNQDTRVVTVEKSKPSISQNLGKEGDLKKTLLDANNISIISSSKAACPDVSISKTHLMMSGCKEKSDQIPNLNPGNVKVKKEAQMSSSKTCAALREGNVSNKSVADKQSCVLTNTTAPVTTRRDPSSSPSKKTVAKNMPKPPAASLENSSSLSSDFKGQKRGKDTIPQNSPHKKT